MKYLLYSVIFLALASCSKDKSTDSFLLKFGNKEVYSAEFIQVFMTLGFIKHGKPFYTKIHDEAFFESSRRETIEHFVNNFFIGSLSQKYKLKITDKELEEWIESRTEGLSREDLLYTLKANNLEYRNWKNLFKDQLVQHKIIEILSEKNGDENIEPRKLKKSTDQALFFAVLNFEDRLKADEAYKKLSSNKITFKDLSKKEQRSSAYSWVKNKDIPFYSKIRHQRLNKPSRPIETQWGHAIINIKKKGLFPLQPKNVAVGQSIIPKSLIEDFRKDPKLQINTDLLYSLKIKK